MRSQVSSRVSERDALAAPELSVDVQFELSDQLAPGQAREAVTQMAQDIQAGAPALDCGSLPRRTRNFSRLSDALC